MRSMHGHGLYNTGNDQAEDADPDRQAIFHEMEKRYDSAFVQSIRDHVHAADIRDIRYMEMKQMQEIPSPVSRARASYGQALPSMEKGL